MSLLFPSAYANPLGGKRNTAGIGSTILVHGVIVAIVAFGFAQSEALTEMAQPLAVRLIEAVQPEEKPPAPLPPPPRQQSRTQAKVVKAAVLSNTAPSAENSFVVPDQPPAATVIAAAPTPAPVVETLLEARFDADYLANPKPPYPSASRRLSEAGTVYLRVQVSAEGRAHKVELKASSGFSRLDQSAVDTVAQWRFVPAKRGNTAVSSWVIVPIIFSLT